MLLLLKPHRVLLIYFTSLTKHDDHMMECPHDAATGGHARERTCDSCVIGMLSVPREKYLSVYPMALLAGSDEKSSPQMRALTHAYILQHTAPSSSKSYQLFKTDAVQAGIVPILWGLEPNRPHLTSHISQSQRTAHGPCDSEAKGTPGMTPIPLQPHMPVAYADNMQPTKQNKESRREQSAMCDFWPPCSAQTLLVGAVC